MLFRFSSVFLLCCTILSASIGSAQIITTVAGTGISGYTGDGTPATLSKITPSSSCVFDRNGNLIVVGGVSSNRIRMIDPSGIIHTVAGLPAAGFSGDGGPATAAQLNHPYGIAVDTAGNIFVADHLNYRIRKIDANTNIISTIAGNGIAATTGDGSMAISASVVPYAVCVDKMNNVFFIDGYGTKVRRIDPSGIITTIAGTGVAGFSGDGGPATGANLTMNYGICVDESGTNVYVAADTRIRKIDLAANTISTIGGTGSFSYSGDGIPATSASFSALTIGLDRSSDVLYIGDIGNDRVYQIDPSGVFHLVAGTGVAGFGGDGVPATSAQLNNPEGVGVDVCGNLYIGDGGNYRIRKVTFNPYTTPSIAATGATSAAIGSTVTVNATVSGAAGSCSIKWFRNSSLFSATTVPTVTYTKGAGTDTITARVVPAASYCSDSATSAPHLVAASGVAVEEVTADADLLVYPSPAGAVLHVSATAVIKHVQVTNLLGQTVIGTSGNSNAQQLDVSALPQGVYQVRVNDVWVRRFVKE